MVGPLLLLEQQ